jgi:hypothetical protein
MQRCSFSVVRPRLSSSTFQLLIFSKPKNVTANLPFFWNYEVKICQLSVLELKHHWADQFINRLIPTSEKYLLKTLILTSCPWGLTIHAAEYFILVLRVYRRKSAFRGLTPDVFWNNGFISDAFIPRSRPNWILLRHRLFYSLLSPLCPHPWSTYVT